MLDERRRFSEPCAGASSGVIGLSHLGEITLANTMAQELLRGDQPGS